MIGIKTLLFSLALFLFSSTVYANETWAHNFGDTESDYYAASIQPTSDGGSIIGGSKYTNYGPPGYTAQYLLRLNSAGDPLWEVTGEGWLGWAEETSDAGVIAAGSTGAYGIVLKLNASGGVDWQRSYSAGQNTSIEVRSIHQLQDGRYWAAGVLHYEDGPRYAWLASLDYLGNIVWKKRYNENYHDDLVAMQITPDGGCLLGLNLYDRNYRNLGIAVIRINSRGKILWQKKIHTRSGEKIRLNSIAATNDGGGVAGGLTSREELLTGWALKVDSSGNPLWKKEYDLVIGQVLQTPEGGYLINGTSAQSRALIKTDPDGSPVWQKTYTGDYGPASMQSDGYVVAAHKMPYSWGFLSPESPQESSQGSEISVIRLDADGSYPFCSIDVSIPYRDIPRALRTSAVVVRSAAVFEVNAPVAFQQSVPDVLSDTLFCDNFDSGNLSSYWISRNGTWTVQDGMLTGTPNETPANILYSGLQHVQTLGVSVEMRANSHGRASILVWYKDQDNYVELTMDLAHSTLILRNKVEGVFIAEDRVQDPDLEPGVDQPFVVIAAPNYYSGPIIVAATSYWGVSIPIRKDFSLTGTIVFRSGDDSPASFNSVEVLGLPLN